MKKKFLPVNKLAAAIALVTMSSGLAAQTTTGQWETNYNVARQAYLNTHQDVSSLSGSLAWGESYYLDSLLEMYIATEDTSYLTTFVTRMKMVLDKATYDTGSGDKFISYKGWADASLAPKVVANWDAKEKGVDPTDSNDTNYPVGWLRWQSNKDTAYREAIMGDDGNGGTTEVESVFTVKTDPASNMWHVLQTPLKNAYQPDNDYELNTTYKVTFRAKSDSAVCKGSNQGYLEIRDYDSDGSDDPVLYSQLIDFEKPIRWSDRYEKGYNKHTPDYNQYEGEFTSPGVKGHNIQVRLYHKNYWDDCSTMIDYVAVQAVSEYAAHDGMLAAVMAKYIKLVKQGKAPAPEPEPGEVEDLITSSLKMLDDHIFKKWADYLRITINGDKIYYSTDDAASSLPNAELPHNQYLTLQMAYAHLVQTPGVNIETDFGGHANGLLANFKSVLKLKDNKYYWPFWSAEESPNGVAEDSSHANIDIAAAVNSYQAGLAFSQQDMTYFANTAKEIMTVSGDKLKICRLINETFDENTNTACDEELFEAEALRWWLKLSEFDVCTSKSDDCHYNESVLYNEGARWVEHRFNHTQDNKKMNQRERNIFQPKLLGALAELSKGLRLYNQNFNATSSGEIPKGWKYWQSDANTAYVSADSANNGTNGLTVKSNGTSWQVAFLPFDYEPGATYKIKVMGKVASGSLGGKIDVLAENGGLKKLLNSSVFTNSDWAQHTITFTAPTTAGQDLRLRLYPSKWNVSGEVHFDDFEVYRVFK